MKKTQENQSAQEVAQELLQKIAQPFWRSNNGCKISQIQSYQGGFVSKEFFFGTEIVTVAIFYSTNYVTVFIIRGAVSALEKKEIPHIQPLALIEIAIDEPDKVYSFPYKGGKINLGSFTKHEMEVFVKILEVSFVFSKTLAAVKKAA